jgi:carbon-monoxide dehydrogenase medium subunit
MPMMAFRLATPTVLVDLAHVAGLDTIDIGPDGIRLGALVTWRDIELSTALPTAHPLLSEAVSHIAHYQIRNRGTVGGSLANADPASELCGIAVTCDAQIEMTGSHGQRTLPAESLFTGALITTLAPDELITAISFPPWPTARRWAFMEFARHRGDFALAGVALHYDQTTNGNAIGVRIGAIAANPTPLRLKSAEQALENRLIDTTSIAAACTAARNELDPPDDIHASADYRRSLVATLLERSLRRAAAI